MVQFHSDEHEADAGFQIHYSIVEGKLESEFILARKVCRCIEGMCRAV